jgi:hypothetical protein
MLLSGLPPVSNNYEVCTAVARCFPNIIDVMILENIKLWSSEKDLNLCHQ